MNELYWITRFDAIHILGYILTWIPIATCLITLIMSITTDDWTGKDVYNEKQKISLRKISKRSAIISIIGILMLVFVPTTKQALVIYGVGGTIDYVKSDSTAKQLPKKAVLALDKYLNEITNDKK